MTYLITFSCYGTHLHGEPGGRVDRRHNQYGGRRVLENDRLAAAQQATMLQLPYSLDPQRRTIVLKAICSRSSERQWTLLAAHVRQSHVHVILDADAKPDAVLTALKASASHHLNLAGLDPPERKRWSRHGSTRYLWNHVSISAAIRYVLTQQGPPMAIFPD